MTPSRTGAAHGVALRRARARIERLCTGLPDPRTLFARLNDIVPAVVAVDGVCGLTLDPTTLLHTGGYHERGVPHSHLPRLLEIEYGEADVNQFPDLVRSGRTTAGLWHSTRHRPHASSRYRDVYRPTGLGDELRVLLRGGGTVWGALVLHRGGDRPPFDEKDFAALSALAPTVARGLRSAYLRHDADAAEADAATAPGLLTFDPGGGVDRVTPAGQVWLDQLGGSPAGPGLLQQPVLHVRSKARAEGEASLRVLGRGGRWVSVTGTLMDEDGRVAVILRPSAPEHVLGIMMEAYGLTRREQHVAQLVVYGLSDGEIAARLTISPHTVRDHLKKVFDKTGTNSRGRLLRLLYFRHYQPAIDTGRAMGSRGWFAPGTAGPADAPR
ncbi:LuxR C-terminal-related transcriptional regulator [Streptomyces sp. NPDC127068]|uniref:LuxR C-terminal-related transcriptional regulator n=1 Tax=Streptomyces sp. NPDC127068 TaxID=3347127 RepID=UPI00365DE01B